MTPSEEILRRFDTLHESFHPALREGGQALDSFYASFNSLIHDPSLRTIDGRMQESICVFVDIAKTVSSSMLDIETSTRSIHVDFEKLSLSDAPEKGNPAPYIECCYTWLLGHLNNPYPSKAIRQQFSLRSGAPERDIESWFIEARRRIGWNDIRKAYFKTRFEMVKAATRFFHPASSKIKLDAGNLTHRHDKDSITYHFANMEHLARSWYSHKFFPTSIAANLSRTVDQHAAHAENGLSGDSPQATPRPTAGSISSTITTRPRKRQRSMEDELGVISSGGSSSASPPAKRSRLHTPSSYSSSLSSIASSPEASSREPSASLSPCVAPPSLEEEHISTTIQHENRKRRLSNASDHGSSDSSRSPPARRRRLADDCDTTLEATSESFSRDVGAHLQPQSFSSTTSKRKRRLSDAHGERPRKNPHHPAFSVPRLQTVSTPLPMVSSPDPEDNITAPPADLQTGLDAPYLTNLQSLDFDTLFFGTMPAVDSCLSQSTGSATPATDITSDLGASSSITSQLIPSQASASTDDLDLLFNFGVAPTDQICALSYDDLFVNVEGMLSDNVGSTTSNGQIKLGEQTGSSTLGQNLQAPMEQQLTCVAPFDLSLSSTSLPTLLGTNTVMGVNPSVIGTGPAVVSSSQANFAYQEIQRLQAELDMVKNQLAQHNAFRF